MRVWIVLLLRLVYVTCQDHEGELRILWGGAKSGFIFVRTIFVRNRKVFTFFQAHSHASTNATRRHEYFRGLSRSFGVIS